MELEVVAMRTMLRIILGCAVGFAVSTLAEDANAQAVTRPVVRRPVVQRPTIVRPQRVHVSVVHPQRVSVQVQKVQRAHVSVTRPVITRAHVTRPTGVKVSTRMTVGGTKSAYASRGTLSGGSNARLYQPIKEMTIAAVEPAKPLVYPRTETIELWTTPPPRLDEEADA